MPAVTWAGHVSRAQLELDGPSAQVVRWKPVGGNETFGVQMGGDCVPGRSAGAAKRCYRQLNNAFIAAGTFFISAFAAGAPPGTESIVGVDVRSGQVVLEHEHEGGNLIDMAWAPWDAPATSTHSL